jgi:uncharacterized protein YxjI
MDEPEPLDPELERLVAWFVQNRDQITVEFDQDEVSSTDGGIFGIKHKVDKHGNVKAQVKRLAPAHAAPAN